MSENSYLKQFYEINISEIMIFRLYTIFNKNEMIKIDSQTRENLQILSQVLEKFCCRLYGRQKKILKNGAKKLCTICHTFFELKMSFKADIIASFSDILKLIGKLKSLIRLRCFFFKPVFYYLILLTNISHF